MTTGTAGEGAARPGRLRASHADREQAIGALKAAFIQGRLAKDELDARVGEALAARTHAELALLTDDIPATPDRATVQPPPLLSVRSGVCVTTLAAVLAAILWLAAISAGSAAAGAAAPAVTGFVLFTMFATAYQAREARRPARPLPPGRTSRPPYGW